MTLNAKWNNSQNHFMATEGRMERDEPSNFFLSISRQAPISLSFDGWIGKFS